MRYYPAFLDIKNRRCLVVGGGGVATRKVVTLLACGAEVIVVSPRISDGLKEMIAESQIAYLQRTYDDEDLRDVFLVIGATDDEEENRRIHHDAEQRGCLCNIADQPHLCNFILPSVINQGDLTIAISTSGKSPAFAKHLRRRLQDQFGPEYATLLTLMGAIRNRLLKEAHAPEAHKPLFEQLIAGGLLEKIRSGNPGEIDMLLVSVLGPGFQYDQLMDAF
jgi:precorrin-2 dehydrogenase/sirohydrochlorin ferrochelatase